MTCGSSVHGHSDVHPTVLDKNDFHGALIWTGFHAEKWGVIYVLRFPPALHADDFLPLFTLAFLEQAPRVKFIIIIVGQFLHCSFVAFIQGIQTLSPTNRAQCSNVSCRTTVPAQSAVIFPFLSLSLDPVLLSFLRLETKSSFLSDTFVEPVFSSGSFQF